MTTEAIVLSIVSGIFTILLGIVTFFLKGILTKLEQALKDIQSLYLALQQNHGRFGLIEQGCVMKHESLNRQIDTIEKRLIKTESDVAEIKSEH